MGKHETISVEEFKARAAELLDQISSGAVTHITLTEGGTAIAEIDRKPKAGKDEEIIVPPFFGCMKGTVKVAPGVDLTDPTDEDWELLKDD